ncbi:Uncharacterized protein TCM_031806 [Theobroma cacao]|uniref:Uncharacterized protein n=1 Tax=Theobroma cacao TaxID=3641 RepID=A0A061F9B4_THECC|nr:Uncharacterized protein TCM_031806 [Theobroma cacao]
MSIGRAPRRVLEDMFSCKISTSLVKVEGIESVNLLRSNNKCLREMRSPKHAGIGPTNLLPARSKKPKLFKWHNSAGMDPSNLFPSSERLCKFRNLPIVVGIAISSLLSKFKPIKLLRYVLHSEIKS